VKTLFTILLSLFTLSISAEEVNDKLERWSVGIGAGLGDPDNNELLVEEVYLTGIEIKYSFGQNFQVKSGLVGGSETDFLPIKKEYDFRKLYFAFSARTSEPLFIFASLGLGFASEIHRIDGAINVDKKSTHIYFDGGIGWDIGEHFTLSAKYSKINTEYTDTLVKYIQFDYNF